MKIVYNNTEMCFDVLKGKVIIFCELVNNDTEIYFKCQDGAEYKLTHLQDCCEQVYIESIVGNLNDLLNNPVLVAEVSYNESKGPLNPEEEDDSFTWTFYKLATIKGHVDIRFYGTSNGYYSEEASLVCCKHEKEGNISTLLKELPKKTENYNELDPDFIKHYDIFIKNFKTILKQLKKKDNIQITFDGDGLLSYIKIDEPNSEIYISFLKSYDDCLSWFIPDITEHWEPLGDFNYFAASIIKTFNLNI